MEDINLIEGNNELNVALKPIPSEPAYSVVLGVSNTTPVVSEVISWWVDITNIGDVTSEARIDWYIDGVTPGHTLASALAPGASHRYYGNNINFDIPGTHTLGVKVNGTIDEIMIEIISTLPLTDYLNMSKDKLYSYLINGSVAKDWWNLSYNDRRQLGLKMAQWWSYEWFGPGIALAKGDTACGGIEWFNPREEPEKTIGGHIGIGMEFCSGLRYCLFSDNTIAPTDIYWWRSRDEKWYCYNSGVCFHLPTGVAIGDADWLNCLQLDKDVTKLDSWLFFQTYFIECTPGFDAHLWAINIGAIEIYKVAKIDDRGRTALGSSIALIYY